MRISDARDVINDAKAEHARRVKRAADLYADFTGRLEHDGLRLTVIGDYVLVDDGADRWLGDLDDYVDALADVLKAVVDDGKYLDEDEGTSAPYDALCSDCPALYSRIGSGQYNDDLPGLLKLLAEDLNESQVEEVADYLGIEVPEPAEEEEAAEA